MNRKDCKGCGKPSFSSVGEKQNWICPFCGNNLIKEPLKHAESKKKHTSNKMRSIER